MKNIRFSKLEKNFIIRKIDNKLFFLNIFNNSLLFLENLSLEIWDLLDSYNIDEIILIFSKKYKVDINQIKKDVLECIKDFIENGLLFIKNNKNELKNFFNHINKKEIDNENLDIYTYSDFYDIFINNNIFIDALLNITDNCNLACQHCYLSCSFLKNKDDILSTDDILSIINQLGKQGCFSLTLSGGEPFIRKDIIDIIDYSLNYSFKLDILTNGTLLNGRIRTYLFNLQENLLKKLKIGISLYSLNEDKHNNFVKSINAFKKTIETINVLKDFAQINFVVKIPLSKYNIDEIDDFIKWSKKENISINFDPNITYSIKGYNNPILLRISDDEIVNLIKTKKVNYQSETICLAGIAKCNIASNGDLYPCEILPYKLGNIKIDNIENIKNSNEMKKFKNLINKFFNLKSKCNCDIKNNCFICPGFSYIENGNFSTISKLNCLLNKKLNLN